MALFTILQKGRQCKCSSTDGWINTCSTYLYNETFGNKKMLATAEMNLENWLSERNQSQKTTYYIISFT